MLTRTEKGGIWIDWISHEGLCLEKVGLCWVWFPGRLSWDETGYISQCEGVDCKREGYLEVMSTRRSLQVASRTTEFAGVSCSAPLCLSRFLLLYKSLPFFFGAP